MVEIPNIETFRPPAVVVTTLLHRDLLFTLHPEQFMFCRRAGWGVSVELQSIVAANSPAW